MRKKLLTILITMSLLTTLVGCGNSATPSSVEDNAQATTTDTQNKDNEANNDELAKNQNDSNKKEEVNDNKTTTNNSVEKSTDSSHNNSKDSNSTNAKENNSNTESKSNKSSNTNNDANSTNHSNNAMKEENSKNETTNSPNKENTNSKAKSSAKNNNSTKNENLDFQSLAKIITKKEYQSSNIGNIFPVKVTRKGNDLTFEEDPSSNVFLNITGKFQKAPKDGMLILILPDIKKEGDKTYHSFKLSDISMIEDGGTGTVDIGRIYSDGTVKFGEF